MVVVCEACALPLDSDADLVRDMLCDHLVDHTFTRSWFTAVTMADSWL